MNYMMNYMMKYLVPAVMVGGFSYLFVRSLRLMKTPTITIGTFQNETNEVINHYVSNAVVYSLTGEFTSDKLQLDLSVRNGFKFFTEKELEKTFTQEGLVFAGNVFKSTFEKPHFAIYKKTGFLNPYNYPEETLKNSKFVLV